LVALNHRGDHAPWYANVVKINNLLNAKIEGARRVGDESHHHALLHAGFGELDQLGKRPCQLDTGGQGLLLRNGFGVSLGELFLGGLCFLGGLFIRECWSRCLCVCLGFEGGRERIRCLAGCSLLASHAEKQSRGGHSQTPSPCNTAIHCPL
jgi:hypothetical protein